MLLAVALTLVMVGLTVMATGVGGLGPGQVMVTKAAVPPIGLVATLVLGDAAATVLIAVAWAFLAAVKWKAVGFRQAP